MWATLVLMFPGAWLPLLRLRHGWLATNQDSTTGKIRDLRPGKYGDSPVYDFFENKLSPAAGVVNDLRKGETRSGEKPTIANEAVHLFAPIAATNYVELKNDPNSANILLAMIADALGISTNTYSGKRKRTK